jgi:UDP-GlcNAc:undecaprenyl-phosphate GlcNAc-1-phosphate transferase
VLVTNCIRVLIASLGMSLVLTRVVRTYAVAHGLLSTPQSSRHLHRKPVPRLGGVAIFVSVITTLGLTMLVEAARGTSPILPSNVALGIAVPATGIFFLGLWDDLVGVSPKVKFFFQAAAGVYLYFSGFSIRQVTFLPSLQGRIISLFLTVLWVVLITNAFNLIDGLDGLAAGSALFSSIVMLSCFLLLGSAPGALVTVVLAGAIAGFLRYNFNPATIFLGDCGSLFIGFVLSALGLVQSAKATTMLAVAVPVVSFGLPVLDLGLAVVRRFLSGRPLFAADGEHIHHKLLERGLSHRHAVLVLYCVSALFALTSLFMLYPSGKPMALVFTVLGLGLVIGLQQLRYHEVSEIERVVRRTLQQKQIIANNLRIRRAAQELANITTHAELAEILVRALEPVGFCGITLAPAAKLKMPISAVTPMVHTPDGTLQFVWDTDEGLERCWELKLPLISRAGILCGVLSILHRNTAERLQMDMNLFTQVLQAAVADAVLKLSPVKEHQKLTMQAGVADAVLKLSPVKEHQKLTMQAGVADATVDARIQ